MPVQSRQNPVDWVMAYAFSYSTKPVKVLLVCIFVSSGLWSLQKSVSSIIPLNEPEGFYTTNEATTTVADEYMPKWVSYKPMIHAAERLFIYNGNGLIIPNTVTTQTIDVTVQAAETSIVQINTIYYPGWGATLDETKVLIDYSNNQGIMRIRVPAGRHHLIVSFRETISRFLADVVSMGSVAFYVVLIIISASRKRKKQ